VSVGSVSCPHALKLHLLRKSAHCTATAPMTIRRRLHRRRRRYASILIPSVVVSLGLIWSNNDDVDHCSITLFCGCKRRRSLCFCAAGEEETFETARGRQSTSPCRRTKVKFDRCVLLFSNTVSSRWITARCVSFVFVFLNRVLSRKHEHGKHEHVHHHEHSKHKDSSSASV
jgi:hypothetical protein